MARPSTRPILVVEDDPDSCAMLTTFLECDGLGVVTASNGREAYNIACQHHPCIILLDLILPIMTGEEFRRAEPANTDIRGIPVVVVSAHHQAARIAQRMKAEACLTKPVDFDVLTNTLHRIMERQGPE